MRRRLFVIFAALVSVLLLSPAAVAKKSAGDKPLPVPYNFIPAVIAGGMPGANAPGTNDWNCKPTKTHPRPVILIHGTGGNRATNWQTYGPLLKNEGYCVFALTYGVSVDVFPLNLLAGMDDMRQSAEQLKRFVDRVLSATGAKKVDLVGHSQGTLMPNWYVKFLGGHSKVKNYVSLAPLWHGTSLTNVPSPFTLLSGGQIPYCKACNQFAPNSEFMKMIREGGAAVKGVRYTNIMTKFDELVVPYSSGIEAGMHNIVVQDTCSLDFSDHLQIAASRNASVHVLRALDRRNPPPITCGVSLPVFGGLSFLGGPPRVVG